MKIKHPMFCKCNACKIKRKSNIFYLSSILVTLIVVFYQLLLLVFITTRLNAIILLFEFLLVGFLVFFILL